MKSTKNIVMALMLSLGAISFASATTGGGDKCCKGGKKTANKECCKSGSKSASATTDKKACCKSASAKTECTGEASKTEASAATTPAETAK